MITVFDILMPILTFIFAYLVGGIPTSIIFGKLFFKQDPREYGSKNPGGTNATRLWGKKVGFTIIAIDMIKSILPIWVAILILRLTPLNDPKFMCEDAIMWGIWLSAFGSILGHCYSIYLKFQGGKGVSTYIGSLGTTSIFQFIVGFVTFLTTLFTKKMVSLASLVMTILALLISWMFYILHVCGYTDIVNMFFICAPGLISINIAYPIVVTMMSAVLILRHSQNIIRIKNGTEKRIKSK